MGPIDSISVEICCGSLEDCKTAYRCGANGIELVSAHLLGGLTPSLGLLRKVKEAVPLPVSVMVRPRGAGFCYSEEDFAVMCEDARLFAQAGADGLVFGFLLPDGSLDQQRCARFLDYTGNCETVFHRAIDVTPDPIGTAKTLADLGFTRILTSGGKSDALAGASVLKELVHQVGHRVQILAGGGVRAGNVRALVEQTGVTQVHLGGTCYAADTSTLQNPALCFGTTQCPPNDCYIAVNEKTISETIRALYSNG